MKSNLNARVRHWRAFNARSRRPAWPNAMTADVYMTSLTYIAATRLVSCLILRHYSKCDSRN